MVCANALAVFVALGCPRWTDAAVCLAQRPGRPEEPGGVLVATGHGGEPADGLGCVGQARRVADLVAKPQSLIVEGSRSPRLTGVSRQLPWR